MRKLHVIQRLLLFALPAAMMLLFSGCSLTVQDSGTGQGSGIEKELPDYSSEFNIPRYISSHDEDGDGLDDQTDILRSAREYTASMPKYKSAYYSTGYPDDGYGVCTDVVGFALLGAGYDLMHLVNTDIQKDPAAYGIGSPDINIDFRRVPNLNVYFSHTAQSLTTDPNEIAEWQGGDIVVFDHHIALVSDRRNKKGIPYIIHHVSAAQSSYEQDALVKWEKKAGILGHYRIS